MAKSKNHNELSLAENGKSPLETFNNIEDDIMCYDWYTWGCPCFVVAEENQSGLTETRKWEPITRTGVYLGHYPAHTGNVVLVLNILTGHVSLQYYVVFDNKFTTIEYLQSVIALPSWCNFYQNSCEKVNDEQYNMVYTWYEGEKSTQEIPHDNSNNIDDLDIEGDQTIIPST